MTLATQTSHIPAQLRRITSEAAAAAGRWKGYGDAFKNTADGASVDAMHNGLTISTVSCEIGECEGKKDGAPMLSVGKKYNPKEDGSVDFTFVADPVEGTSFLVHDQPGAMALAALATHGSLPDWAAEPFVPYTKKLAVAPDIAFLINDGHITVDGDPTHTMQTIAEALGIDPDKPVDLHVAVLDRERNRDIIEAAKKLGVTSLLLRGGDVLPVMQACTKKPNLVLLSSGGTPEALLAAIFAAIKGGAMHAKLHPQDNTQRDALRAKGKDKATVLSHLPGAELHFAGVGITGSDLLRGCERDPETGVWLAGSPLVISRT